MRALIIEKRVQNLSRLTTCSSYTFRVHEYMSTHKLCVIIAHMQLKERIEFIVSLEQAAGSCMNT